MGNLYWKGWPQQLCSICYNIGQSLLETFSIDKKKIKKNVNEIPENEVFLGNNLNFTIRVLTWGVGNDDNIC